MPVMFSLAIAMQLAQPGPPPPAPAVTAATAPAAPAAPAIPPPAAAPVPQAAPWQANPTGAAPWPAPAWQPQRPAADLVANGTAVPPAPKPERELGFFSRLELGLGPRGFGPNNALLDKVGYDAVKTWFTLDMAYMITQRFGLGLFGGLNRRASRPPGGSVGLNAVGYFVGAEAPIALWGQHDAALHFTPRVGFLSGQVELDNARDAAFQNTAIFGGAFSFTLFPYHLGSSIGYLYAPAGAPGELGGNHDYGGLYFALSGTIDG